MCLKCNSSGLTPSHVQVQVAKGAVQSYCRSSKHLGSAGHNKLNKMHVSNGHKSVICNQHEVQPWWQTDRERKSCCHRLRHHSHMALIKETYSSLWSIIAAGDKPQSESRGCNRAHGRGNWLICCIMGKSRDLATKWSCECNRMTAVST